MSKRKNGAVHRRKEWCCPYFKWDGPTFLSCEAGRPSFPSRTRANAYMVRYCADMQGWKQCPLAKEWNEYYENREDEHAEGRS